MRQIEAEKWQMELASDISPYESELARHQADIAARIRPELVEFHRFADCGHGAYRDCPDTAIPIIRDFILKHAPGS